MKTSDLIVSKFIRKEELKTGSMVLTIADITLEQSGFRGNQSVLWFEETAKGLGMNNTKLKLLEAAYGEDTDLWQGHRVRLSFDASVKMGREVVGGIKIEASKPRGAPVAPPGAPPPPVWNAALNGWELPAGTSPVAPRSSGVLQVARTSIAEAVAAHDARPVTTSSKAEPEFNDDIPF